GLQSPANSVITAKWFPRQERGFLNALIFSGTGAGSLITYATSGAMCSSALFGGWPSLYFIYGGLGLVLGLCAYLFLYESPKEHPKIGKAELFYILENQESDLSQKVNACNSGSDRRLISYEKRKQFLRPIGTSKHGNNFMSQLHSVFKLGTQIAILVCNNLALQICKLAANLTRKRDSLNKYANELVYIHGEPSCCFVA
ncbi:hypothetical protein AVEN_124927-1, partial [Araneus ventricosus]